MKVLKTPDGFQFTNPGILKLPKDEIFKGGNSKPRNSRMQIMLRLVGYGDNAGSGFPSIVRTWAEEGWKRPELIEDITLNQVTLNLKAEAFLTVTESEETTRSTAETTQSATETTQSTAETTQSATETTQSTTQFDCEQVFDLSDKDWDVLKVVKKLPEISQSGIAAELG